MMRSFDNRLLGWEWDPSDTGSRPQTFFKEGELA
jgi:hypothetical protein